MTEPYSPRAYLEKERAAKQESIDAANKLYNEREAKRLSKVAITPEFMDTLVEVARIYGWDGDYVEVRSFVSEVCRLGGRVIQDDVLEPYDFSKD